MIQWFYFWLLVLFVAVGPICHQGLVCHFPIAESTVETLLRAWTQSGSGAAAGQNSWGAWQLSLLPALAVQGWKEVCTPSCTRRENSWDLLSCIRMYSPTTMQVQDRKGILVNIVYCLGANTRSFLAK